MYLLYLIPILVIVAFVFLLAPNIRRKADYPEYIAHRGLHDISSKIPENSMSAFEAAIQHGFAIENDIHVTKDGEVVVIHDSDLKRLCGVEGKVENKTLNELKEMFVLETDERIPTLRECLELVDGRVPLLIEFKCEDIDTCNRLCVKANEILKDYKGQYFVQSFYPFVLKWYRQNRSDVIRGQLSTENLKANLGQRLLSALLTNFIARPDFISYEHSYKHNFFRLLCCKLFGAYSFGWTFRDESQLDRKFFSSFIFEGFIPKK